MVYNEGIIYFISIVSEVIAWKLLQEKLNLSVNVEKPKSLQQLTKEELYKSLRESYQVSIHDNDETYDAREVIKGLLAEV